MQSGAFHDNGLQETDDAARHLFPPPGRWFPYIPLNTVAKSRLVW
jgi:hypothetical protein